MTLMANHKKNTTQKQYNQLINIQISPSRKY